MNDATLLQELNALIDYYIKRNGYQPNKRKYLKIKIKLTKDDDQLELE